MSTSSNVSSYVREMLARLKGDDEQVIAEKNERKARAAFKGQIASLESKIVTDEDKVSEAEEAYKVAKYPTHVISDTDDYVRGVTRAYQNLEDAKEKLEHTKKSLEFFQNLSKQEFEIPAS